MHDSNDLDRSTVRPCGEGRQALDLRFPGLTVLFHPDDARVGDVARLLDLAQGRAGSLSRREPGFSSPAGGPVRPLGSRFLSRRPIRLGPGDDGGLVLYPAPGATPLAVDGRAASEPVALSRERLDRGVVLCLASRVVLLAHRLGPPGGRPLASPLVGHSEAVLRLHQRIASVAALSAPVLIRGETGTGKELVAEAIARGGPRAAGPFITVNLAAVPATTAATELFGHGAGAFTGATRPREGLFAQAHGGSLFLDEIGEVPIEVQAMLLRVLETGEIQPLGAPRRIADVRVIAATDAPLEDKVRCGAFREALFHRLAGLPLRTPSLEERRDDVGRLFFHFLRRELDGSGHGELLSRLGDEDPWLPASTFAALAQVRLPGNVRQLANLVRQMVILATEGRPVTGALEGLISIDQVPAGAPAAEPDSRPRRAVDEAALLDALRANAWKPSVAARQLGISRTTLYSLIDRSARIRKATEIPMDELRACLEACAGDIDAMAAQLEVSRKSLTLRIRETGLVRRRS